MADLCGLLLDVMTSPSNVRNAMRKARNFTHLPRTQGLEGCFEESAGRVTLKHHDFGKSSYGRLHLNRTMAGSGYSKVRPSKLRMRVRCSSRSRT